MQLKDWTFIMINKDPVTAFSSTLNNIYVDSFPLIVKSNKNNGIQATLGLNNVASKPSTYSCI